MADGVTLIEEKGIAMEQNERDHRIIDYWRHGSGLKWQSLTQKLSNTHAVLLASVVLRPETELEDVVGWLKTGAGGFSVKKAYKLARNSEEGAPWARWKLLWKTKAGTKSQSV